MFTSPQTLSLDALNVCCEILNTTIARMARLHTFVSPYLADMKRDYFEELVPEAKEIRNSLQIVEMKNDIRIIHIYCGDDVQDAEICADIMSANSGNYCFVEYIGEIPECHPEEIEW